MTKQYKLVYSSNDEPWLVDIQADSNELVNLYGLPAHADTVRSLTDRLLASSRTHNDVFAREPQIPSPKSMRHYCRFHTTPGTLEVRASCTRCQVVRFQRPNDEYYSV